MIPELVSTQRGTMLPLLIQVRPMIWVHELHDLEHTVMN